MAVKFEVKCATATEVAGVSPVFIRVAAIDMTAER